MRISKKRVIFAAAVIFAAIFVTALMLANYFNLLPQKTYTAEHFGIETLRSRSDFNENGTDDYTDIMLGARLDAENHPSYDGRYCDGGFPPDNIGVCTDVVWRAFKNAGYNLREMVDADIARRPEAYPAVTSRDKNIDFRRVRNLRVFFDGHAQSLTTDPDDISEWQPGDIVIFGENKHIGIVSDRRNKEGRAYIIHNGGQPNREEDYLKRGMAVAAHYRFDASAAEQSVLIPWQEGK